MTSSAGRAPSSYQSFPLSFDLHVVCSSLVNSGPEMTNEDELRRSMYAGLRSEKSQ